MISTVFKNSLIFIGIILFINCFLIKFVNSQNLSDSISSGQKISETHCSRCHVVSNESKYGGIGSTPSFIGLRNLSDWKIRFSEFFLRPPHPAFINISEITAERSEMLPSFVKEIDLTLGEVEHLLNYVETLKK